MIILPTIYRPDNLKRFLAAYIYTDASLPVYVVYDEYDAHNYSAIALPPHWKTIAVKHGTCIGDIFNKVFQKFPDEEYYGIMADDVVPETFRWDILLKEACMPDKIAWGFDGGHNETLIRHPFIGGDLARKMGFVAAPGIKHWFVDNVWSEIVRASDKGAYRPEIKILHHHYTNGKARMDRTYETQPDHGADEIAYINYMKNEFPGLIDRLA